MAIPLERASTFYEGLDHPECVAVHPDGSVWAGGEAGQIYRISPDGKDMDQVASTGGFNLGIAFSPDASWLAVCDLKNKCVWRVDTKSGRVQPFASGAGKHKFGIPNYPVFDEHGALYVSDSGAFRQVSGKVLKFPASGDGDVWHNGPFNFANGMALGPKRDALYVVCTWLPGVERIEIRPDGSAGKRSVYAKMRKVCPDGAAFDAWGNLYVSCYYPARILKVSRQQRVTVFVDDWEAHTISNCTNIAFGGRRFDQLFVANLGRWHITRIDVRIRGAPLVCHPNPNLAPITEETEWAEHVEEAAPRSRSPRRRTGGAR